MKARLRRWRTRWPLSFPSKWNTRRILPLQPNRHQAWHQLQRNLHHCQLRSQYPRQPWPGRQPWPRRHRPTTVRGAGAARSPTARRGDITRMETGPMASRGSMASTVSSASTASTVSTVSTVSTASTASTGSVRPTNLARTALTLVRWRTTAVRAANNDAGGGPRTRRARREMTRRMASGVAARNPLLRRVSRPRLASCEEPLAYANTNTQSRVFTAHWALHRFEGFLSCPSCDWRAFILYFS